MGSVPPKKQTVKPRERPYDNFRTINGDHPLKEKVPFAYVEYEARKRQDGKVVFFNFRLAKEMGLISDDHPHHLNKQLEATLLDTFGIIIINEYDIINNTPIPIRTKKANTYMATRYLQLQHKDKRGLTSGDGRSIWNGYYEGKGRTWDVTSCGTGATCLSPAHSLQNKFFQSGDPSVSYGCGYAQVDEGLAQVLFSEIMHANNVPSERCLAVIEFADGYAVNVRAGLNLLRPSHFFNHLKQSHWQRLKAVVDLFIERETKNKTWKPPVKGKSVYDAMLEHLCDTFAEITARFENEYIFCWLDWDGDNILANGGIIDYGSIRQFGLFHKDYRYDDADRYSTSILEQKMKARHTVQTFIQLMDFLKTGRKRPIDRFRNHAILRRFDRTFQTKLLTFFLHRIGYAKTDIDYLVTNRFQHVKSLFSHFRYFESISSSRGLQELPDGIMKDAIFCMRDIMRELPGQLLTRETPFTADEFLAVARSQYATPQDLRLGTLRKKRIGQLQADYLKLVGYLSKKRRLKPATILARLQQRAVVINRKERVTGDIVTDLTAKLMRVKNQFEPERFHRLMFELIDCQILDPDKTTDPYDALGKASDDNSRILKNYMRLILSAREGI